MLRPCSLEGITVCAPHRHRDHAGARDRRAVLHRASWPTWARGSSRSSARARRLCARLRHAHARAWHHTMTRPLAFRVDQPLQGEPDAGPDPRRKRDAGQACWLTRRRAGAKPRAGRGRTHGPGYDVLSAYAPHADRLRHLGLWRRRPLPRQEGLRPADPERGRLSVHHRHARRAGQGRQLRCRHCSGHVCLHQHAGGAAAARAHRPGRTSTCPCWRRWPSGWASRCTTRTTAQPPPPRAAAPAHATIYPYGPFAGRRWRHGDAGPAERARVGGLLRSRCCCSRNWPPTRASTPTPSAANQPARAERR
jgi:hypothetical protein